jgi:hypothetical protein
VSTQPIQPIQPTGTFYDSAEQLLNVPQELKDIPNWVTWKLETVNGRHKTAVYRWHLTPEKSELHKFEHVVFV